MDQSFIDALPGGLDVQALHPHNRNLWARDQTCFNPSKTRFVAAFNIYEHTMMNEMGRVVWGGWSENTAQVQGQMRKHLAYCWERHFAHWLDDDCFAIKIDGGKQHYPIVVIHLEKGLQKVCSFDNLETRASHTTKENLSDCWLENTTKNN